MRAPLLPAPSEDAPSASAAPGCRGEAASKTTPAGPRGGAVVTETGGRGVLIPRQTPDPGRSVPGFISDSALSSIQSLVYRRASGASAMGRLMFLGHEEGSIATPCLGSEASRRGHPCPPALALIEAPGPLWILSCDSPGLISLGLLEWSEAPKWEVGVTASVRHSHGLPLDPSSSGHHRPDPWSIAGIAGDSEV